MHTTPASEFASTLGFGLATIVHVDPFQRSTSVFDVDPVVTSPTAKQLVGLEHETLAKLLVSPVGAGLGTADHCVPFQREMDGRPGPSPTAKQLVALGHAIPCSGPEAGLATSDHAVPFHRSMSALPGPLPTAKQLVALVQATPFKVARIEPAPFGLGTIDHVAPLRRSINVLLTDDGGRAAPTAKQPVALVHATPERMLDCAAAFGLARTDHDDPFQDSVSVCAVPDVLKRRPTAVQLALLIHDTPERALLAKSGAFGLVIVDHCTPFHRSVKVRYESSTPGRSYSPTAKQCVALEHEISASLKFWSVPNGSDGGSSTVSCDQTEPFHRPENDCSALPSMVPDSKGYVPTARQLVALEHDTEVKAPGKLGFETTDHCAPQCTINEPVPTAKQFAAPGHETPVKYLPAGVRSGVLTSSHTDPFQRSTSGWSTPSTVARPTAQQSMAVGQSTSARELGPPIAFGLGTTDHAVPFQRSISVNPSREPTAKQFVELVQSTADNEPVGVLGGLGLATIFHAGAVATGATRTATVGATMLPTTSRTLGHRRIGPPSP